MRRFVCVLLLLISLVSLALAEETPATYPPGCVGYGCEGDEVANLQNALIEKGFLSGDADGVFGRGTESAVKTLQTYLNAQGASVRTDGVADEATLLALRDDSIFEDWYALDPGDSGPLTRKLQTRLIELGFLTGAADGSFGIQTQLALTAFQTALAEQGADIKVNGTTDAATRRYLYEADLSRYTFVTPVFYDANDPLALQAGHLYCQSCILIDADAGKVLFAQQARERMFPASTTKILTLLIALENVDLDARVTIPDEASDVPKDSSRVPIYPGEVMTWRDLLTGMMIRSGNDAANAVAVLLDGSVEAFAARMNARAAELGMKNSRFVNPHGYHDDEHYTTAEDLALLTRYALSRDDFRAVVSTRTYTLAATSLRGELAIENRYAILNPESSLYCPYAFGVKTGYTSSAGRCYVGAAIKDGRTLVAVVLNSGTNSTHKFIDAARLFAYGFAKLGI